MTTYRWVFIIMIFSLISITLLQAYFSYNDYTLKVEEFNKEIGVLFRASIEQEKYQSADEFAAFFESLLRDTTFVIFRARKDEDTGKAVYNLLDQNTPSPNIGMTFSPSTDWSANERQDSLDYVITHIFTKYARNQILENSVTHWTDSIASAQDQFLKNHKFDTLRIQEFLNAKLDSSKLSTTYQLDFTSSDTMLSVQRYGSGIRTQALPMKLWQNDTYVYATFKNPFRDIVRRSAITLGGSFVVILLTLSCFIILMRIILKQKKLVDIKDDFIDNITHELQTPIATLMAANEGIQRYNILADKEKTERYLKISERELQHLSKMVDSIVLNSIYVKQQHYLPKEIIDLDRLLDGLKEKHLLNTNEIIEIDIQNNIPSGSLMTNQLHLTNILDNLMENAIKYNDAPKIKINLSSYVTDGAIKIEVKDNGIGIPKPEQNRIFDKFHRIKNPHKTIKGYGIGLFYVKNILAQLNGHISVESIPNQGSIFTLTFPMNTHE